jgi:hypothetical protein
MIALTTIALVALFGWAIHVLLVSVAERRTRHQRALQRLNEPPMWEYSETESGAEYCAEEGRGEAA